MGSYGSQAWRGGPSVFAAFYGKSPRMCRFEKGAPCERGINCWDCEAVTGRNDDDGDCRGEFDAFRQGSAPPYRTATFPYKIHPRGVIASGKMNCSSTLPRVTQISKIDHRP